MENTYHIKIKDALYPQPFLSQLEYNAPVHGTWNIVHIGMSIPESIQIYICADNCMRGVVMTAAEMDCMDRFYCITLEERDIHIGHLEEHLINNIKAILNSIEHPPIVFIFPVCIHEFLSTDINYVYKVLESTYPDICFGHAYMDPLYRKTLSPEARLRIEMFKGVQEGTKNTYINMLGTDTYYKHSDIHDIYKDIKQLPDCNTYQDYQDLGKSILNICTLPIARDAIQYLSERCHQDYLYLPLTCDYEEIQDELHQLCILLDINEPDYIIYRNQCDKALKELKEYIGDIPITIDYTAHPKPLSLAIVLLDHGINVTKIYLDEIVEEEKKFIYLQNHYPEIELHATVHPILRVLKNKEKTVAIGQKAAFFDHTSHFVNIIQGGGLFGYTGIIQLCELIKDAYMNEKDTEDIVPRKGLGCASII